MKYKKETVYEVLFNPCIHESAPSTISVHRTKKGAYKALRTFLFEKYYEWYNSAGRKHSKWSYNEWWGIGEIELKE